MKKVIFTLVSFCFLYVSSNAQYCGNSGPTQCTPSGQLTQPGLSPNSDSLPPLINGVLSTTVIQFKNFDTIRFGGQLLTIQSLKVDSIGNAPAGTCWNTNKASNTWNNQEDGCIKINGTPCSAPGQYKLKILVTANVGVPIQTDADAAGLKYYVRVKNTGDTDTPVDTSISQPFQAYGPVASCGTKINEVNSNINNITVVPNPFTNKAAVSFFADKAGVMTEKITNMIGSEVYRKTLDVRAGEYTSVIDRNNLPAGVYFYSVSDGKIVATKRIIISE